MLRYTTHRARPGLVALYYIWPGKRAGQFLQSPEPTWGHTAYSLLLLSSSSSSISCLAMGPQLLFGRIIQIGQLCYRKRVTGTYSVSDLMSQSISENSMRMWLPSSSLSSETSALNVSASASVAEISAAQKQQQ